MNSRILQRAPGNDNGVSLQRKSDRKCFSPSLLFDVGAAAGFGYFAEAVIQNDYQAATGATASDSYFDNAFAGAFDPAYIDFIIRNNAHLSEPARRFLESTSLARPDFITDIPSRRELYEVKPGSIPGRYAGKAKLGLIDAYFRRLGIPYVRGNSYSPNDKHIPLYSGVVLGLPTSVSLRIDREEAGLITYELCIETDWRAIAEKGLEYASKFLAALILALLGAAAAFAIGSLAGAAAPALAAVAAFLLLAGEASANDNKNGESTASPVLTDHSAAESVSHKSPGIGLQAKLTINTPGDKYEQEADRVAEEVMRMPEPQVQRQCACGKSSSEGECSECKEKKQEATGSLQRVASSPVGGIAAPPIVNSVLSSPGSPLPTGTRAFMESRFGQDFSSVRVHTNEQAAASCASVMAKAYTVENNIVFGHGEHPSKSKHLLAHELTHVVQQRGARPSYSSGPLQRYESGEHAQFGARFGEPEQEFTIDGVEITYGEMIAMGDLFEKPTDVQRAKADELNRILVLIRRQRDKGPASVKEEEWVAAVGQRYLDLAGKNDSHFAPEFSNPEFTEGSGNHKAQWFTYHKQSLKLAQAGDMDKALKTNAFGDHFLTDAFSAGHLINKQAVTKRAKDNLTDPKSFETEVAKAMLADPRGAILFGYEANPGVFSSWKPMSAAALADAIDRIRYWKSDKFYSTFPKLVHDQLNRDIAKSGGGVEVTNNKDPKHTWMLSGDTTLDISPETRAVAREAVAQSRQNVNDAKGQKAVDYASFALRVWDYVPRPTATGQKKVSEASTNLTDPTQKTTIDAFAALTLDNIDELVRQLVNEGLLRRPAGWTPPPTPVPPSPAPAPVQAPPTPQTGPTFPHTAKTTGSLLRIRSGPGLRYPAVRLLGERGTSIVVISQVAGDEIDGIKTWDQVEGGYVSARFVALDPTK